MKVWVLCSHSFTLKWRFHVICFFFFKKSPQYFTKMNDVKMYPVKKCFIKDIKES